MKILLAVAFWGALSSYADKVHEITADNSGIEPAPQIGAQLLDPRWKCDANRVIQPRDLAQASITPKHLKLYSDGLFQGDRFASFLVDLMDLNPQDTLIQLDQLQRKYTIPEEKNRIALTALNVCVESYKSPVCSYFGDMYLQNLGTAGPSDSASCTLALSYSLTVDQFAKARHYQTRCNSDVIHRTLNERYESRAPQSRLPSLLKLGFSAQPWERDLYARLILAMPVDRRSLLPGELKALGFADLTECDLMRPLQLLSNPMLLPKFLEQPELAARALEVISRMPKAFSLALEQNRELETALLPHFASKQNPRLAQFETSLSAPARQKLERLTVLNSTLPIARKEFVARAESNFPKELTTERSPFRSPENDFELLGQLQNPEWQIQPKFQSSQQVATQALAADRELQSRWRPVADRHDRDLLQLTADAYAQWQQSLLSTSELSVVLDSYQSQIPTATAARETIRSLALELSSPEHREAMEAAYGRVELTDSLKLRAIGALAFSEDRESQQLFKQLTFQVPFDLLKPLLDVLDNESSTATLLFELPTQPNQDLTLKLIDQLKFPKTALPYVIRIAKNPYPRAHKTALALLSKYAMEWPAAVPFFVSKMASLDPVTQREEYFLTRDALAGMGEKIVPLLKESMKSVNERERINALFVLERMGSPAEPLIDELILQLDGPHARSAATALGNIGPKAAPASAKLIRGMLGAREGSFSQPSQFRIALIKIGQPAYKELIAALKIRDLDLFGSICAIFQEQKEDAAEAIPALIEIIEAVKSDGHDKYRAYPAARALGAIGEKSVPELLKFFHKPATPEQLAIVFYTLNELGAKGHSAVPTLIKILEKPGLPESTKRSAIHTLGAMGPAAAPALPHLLHRLKNAKDEYDGVISSLGSLGEKAAPAVPDLMRLLKNARGTSYLFYTLARIGAPAKEAVPYMIKKVKEGQHDPFNALSIMGEVAMPALIEVAADENNSKKQRETALAAIAANGPKASSAIPALRDLLNAKDKYIYEGAIYALGRIGKEAEPAIPDLISFVHGNDEGARAMAATALGGIGIATPEVIAALHFAMGANGYSLRTQGAMASIRIGRDKARAANILISALKGRNDEMGENVAVSLSLAGTDILPLLLRHLETATEFEKRYLVNALGNIGVANKMDIPELRNISSAGDLYLERELDIALRKINKALAR